jgi:ribose 5-phosphate isomerase A
VSFKQINAEKSLAAKEAVKLVENNTVVGLGTGTTVAYFIKYLAKRVSDGLNIKCVATSTDTKVAARKLGIKVVEQIPDGIDLDVDGADEIDLKGNMIKGGGGALLREKIVASRSKKICIIIDSSKLKSSGIGKFTVPIEIFPFLRNTTLNMLENVGGKCTLRYEGAFKTDNGNNIADCDFGIISNPKVLERKIKMIPGVAEVGIFTNLCDLMIIGENGSVKKIEVKRPKRGNL